MKRPSPQLIAEWYAKLRAAGFRDIEDGVRPGKLEWTFRGAQRPPGWRKDPQGCTLVAAVVPWPSAKFEPLVSLADHPTAVYHRGLEHAARALKGSPRKLVLAASNEGAAEAARGLSMSRRTASYQVRKFAIETGLLREAHGS